MKISAHEIFLRELRAPMRRYEKEQNKRRKSKLSKEENLELTQEIHKEFDALFGSSDSEDEQN